MKEDRLYRRRRRRSSLATYFSRGFIFIFFLPRSFSCSSINYRCILRVGIHELRMVQNLPTHLEGREIRLHFSALFSELIYSYEIILLPRKRPGTKSLITVH